MSALTLIPLAVAVVAVANGFLVLRPAHRTSTSVPLSLVMGSVATWALAGVLVVLRPDEARGWLVLVCVAASVMVLGGAWFAVLLSGRADLLSPRLARAAWVEPALVAALAVTSPWHGALVRWAPQNPSGIAVGPAF